MALAISARSAASGMRSGSPTAPASAWVARSITSRSMTSDDDIDPSVALNHLVAPKLEARIRCTFAGLELVLPAVPGADDVRLVLVVGLAEKAPVRSEEVHDPVPDDAFAGRAALVQAVIAVRVVGTSMPVDTDFEPVLADDANSAILHLDVLANENLRHSA